MKNKLTDSNKRVKTEKGKKEWVGDALLGAGSELTARNRELEWAKRSIHELKKIVDWSNEMQKEARLDFEAQIIDLRKSLKACESGLSLSAYRKRK